jgi:mannan endo-1,4-beta-mannosidase
MRTRVKRFLALSLAIAAPLVLTTFLATKAATSVTRNHDRTVYRAARLAEAYHFRVRTPKVPEIGVFKPNPVSPLTEAADFDKAIGHRTSLFLTYSEWGTGFRIGLARAARKLGEILVVQIEPMNISLSAIANGDYDGYLRMFAESVRKFRYPVILGFAHEMNGDWYSWGKGHQPASEWVAAWRHVVDVFRKVKTPNVAWIWTIHHAATGFQPYWPGNNYVNLVGVDGYFTKPNATFHSLFAASIAGLRKLTRDPILIDETAVSPGTKHMLRDVQQLFAGVKQYRLLGFVWFDKNQTNMASHQDWMLETHPLELAAFKSYAAGWTRSS